MKAAAQIAGGVKVEAVIYQTQYDSHSSLSQRLETAGPEDGSLRPAAW